MKNFSVLNAKFQRVCARGLFLVIQRVTLGTPKWVGDVVVAYFMAIRTQANARRAAARAIISRLVCLLLAGGFLVSKLIIAAP